MTGFKTMMGVSAVALAVFFAGSAAVAGTLENVKARGKLVVGVKNDYVPYGFLRRQGRDIVGFEVSLAKYVAKELLGSEDKIELVPVVASNRIEFLTAGRIDAIFATLGVTAERAKVIDFTTESFPLPARPCWRPRKRRSPSGRAEGQVVAASRAPTTTRR